MSLEVDGVWKAGVWTSTVWADNVWREGYEFEDIEFELSVDRSSDHELLITRQKES